MERAEPSPFIKNATLRRSVADLLWNYDRNQFEPAFRVVLLLDCRMPNCTTVVQTASDLFEPQISTKFARKMTLFGPLSD